jgi:hypothetical protein
MKMLPLLPVLSILGFCEHISGSAMIIAILYMDLRHRKKINLIRNFILPKIDLL